MADFLNIIVNSGHVWWQLDRDCLFPADEEVCIIEPDEADMFDLLIKLGAFTSRSQAKKNWQYTGAEIPGGWSEFFVGKKKRHLCIWNPTEHHGDKSCTHTIGMIEKTPFCRACGQQVQRPPFEVAFERGITHLLFDW